MTYTTTKEQALKSYPTYQFYAKTDPRSNDTDSVQVPLISLQGIAPKRDASNCFWFRFPHGTCNVAYVYLKFKGVYHRNLSQFESGSVAAVSLWILLQLQSQEAVGKYV